MPTFQALHPVTVHQICIPWYKRVPTAAPEDVSLTHQVTEVLGAALEASHHGAVGGGGRRAEAGPVDQESLLVPGTLGQQAAVCVRVVDIAVPPGGASVVHTGRDIVWGSEVVPEVMGW